MKKLVLLLTTLIFGLVLVGCEVTATVEVKDTAEISANKASLTFMAGKEDTLTITAKASNTITADSIYFDVFDGTDDVTLTAGIDVLVEEFSTTLAQVDVIVTSSATFTTPGDYTLVLYVHNDEAVDSVSINVTIEPLPVPLTQMSTKLYNPYAKDGYNSALDIVTGNPVAGEVNTPTGKMVYAASDSLIADIAVDNSADIRATNVVAELTSINNGMFVKITKAQYDAATTDVALKALVAGKTFAENEVIVTDQDDITVDGYFVMKLANNRGYAVVQMAELNLTDTEGSTGNTGYLKINYRYTAM